MGRDSAHHWAKEHADAYGHRDFVETTVRVLKAHFVQAPPDGEA